MIPIGPSIPLRTLAVLALRLHHHVRGPKGDYVGLAAAALASWAGVPGPGEAGLITAGILAAHHHLDIGSVLVVAWFGAASGGIVGWLVGLKAGRAALTARGPLKKTRLAALERGDRFYERFGLVAVFFTPSWVAGINGMRWTRYLPANALAALIWTLIVGLGSFLIGPAIADVATDLGLVGGVVVGVLIIVSVATGMRQRSRRRG